MTTTVRLYVKDVWTWMTEADSPAFSLVDAVTSFEIPEAERIRRVKLSQATNQRDRDYWEQWDGRHRLLKRNGQFPTGLVNPVIARLTASGYTLHIDDARGHVSTGTITLPDLLTELRDYQKDAVEKLLAAKRGLVHGATGSGKTVIGLAVAAKLKVPTRIICPNLTVITEWVNKAKEFLGVNIGVYDGSRKNIQPITAISVQSAYRLWKTKAWDLLNRLLTADLLLVDEVHHGGAKSYYETMMACPAQYRYGFSGTVDKRSDEADLLYHAALGEVVVRITSSDLISTGWLTRPRIRFLPYLEPNIIGHNSYKAMVKFGLVNNMLRNALGRDAALLYAGKGRSVLVLVTFIEHGKVLERLIPNAVFVHGEHNALPAQRPESREQKMSRREEIVKDFSDGRIRVLIATRQLLGEGVDVKRIGAIILMGGGKSEIRAIQEVGRGLRPFQGKEEVEIIDFADTLPYLRDHAFERAMTWRSEPAFHLVLQGTWLSGVIPQ